MSNYTITTNFGAKDSLPSGNAGKVIKGSEFTTEFTNIQTAVATKADTAGDTFTGAVTFDAAVTLNSTATITGDLTVDTNTLFVDVSADKVGIGTSSPDEKLDVSRADVGNLAKFQTEDGTNNPKLILSTTATGVKARSSFSTGIAGSFDISTAGGSSYIAFNPNDSEAMRIDSTGNVGIGTDAPNNKLHIKHSDNELARFESTDPAVLISLKDDTATSRIQNLAGKLSLQADTGSEGADSRIDFNVGGSEKMRIKSDGNVGIGTSSPDALLHLESASAPTLKIDDSNSTLALELAQDGSNGSMLLKSAGTLSIGVTNNSSSDTVSFQTKSTERMRIDSDGNVLVGKTANSIDTVGGMIRANGQIGGCVDGDYAGVFNRKTSDGDVVLFRKDSSTVGSIGVALSDNLYLSGVDAGIGCGTGTIYPATTTGQASDNDTDLGTSSTRFNDLYLSGGVYLGGTGSANKLDDYEEGTWTMSISDSESTPNVSSTTNASCQYVKVGDMVTIQGQLVDINKGSLASSSLKITGLPFSIKNTGATRPHGSIQVNNITSTLVNNGLFVQGQPASSYCLIKSNSSGALVSSISGDTLDSGNTSDIFFSLTYIAN